MLRANCSDLSFEAPGTKISLPHGRGLSANLILSLAKTYRAPWHVEELQYACFAQIAWKRVRVL